jgi:hypothetical protein
MAELQLRDPVTVFVLLFLLSLLAAYILFKLLDSRATIKRKGWSAGGAIAGFLIILFGSWYALGPLLRNVRNIAPLSVPNGFKRIIDGDAGFAFAVPSDWQRNVATSVTINTTSPKPKSPSERVNLVNLVSNPCDHPTFSASDPDLATVKNALKKMMGMVNLRDTPTSEPFLGRASVVQKMTLTIPGSVLQPKAGKDYVIDMVMREVYDQQNGRCILLTYPDSDLGREIVSTLNIEPPSR